MDNPNSNIPIVRVFGIRDVTLVYISHNTCRSFLCRLVVLGWSCGGGSCRRSSVAEGLRLRPLDNVSTGTTTTRFKRSCFSLLTIGHMAAMRRCQIIQARHPNQTLKVVHQSHVIYERDYRVFQYVGVDQGEGFPVFRRIARCQSVGRYRGGRRGRHLGWGQRDGEGARTGWGGG